jgi:hypothetical protein
MSDHALAHPFNDASPTERPRARETILYGGLAVGVLDITDAIVFWWLWAGVSPLRILQSVASGLVGADAYTGGWATALLGLGLHFLIAFVVAAVYYGASLRFPMLIRRAFVWGLIYGVAVYVVMSYVVVPLSAMPRRPGFSLASLVNGVVGHALLVGLPVALLARRSARARREA